MQQDFQKIMNLSFRPTSDVGIRDPLRAAHGPGKDSVHKQLHAGSRDTFAHRELQRAFKGRGAVGIYGYSRSQKVGTWL